jgi:hypothetical protein
MQTPKLIATSCILFLLSSALAQDAEKGTNEWALHAYDLRLLIDNLPQFDNPISTSGRTERDKNEAEEMIAMIKAATDLTNWAPDEAAIREVRGMVYINQRESVHAHIRQILAELVKEKKRQVRIQVRVIKCVEPAKTQFTTPEFDDFAAKEGVDSQIAVAQVVCYNGHNAIAYGGREQSYLESFVANTEGGGNVAGAREAAGSPLLEGLTFGVRPLIAPDGKNVELTLRVNLINHLNFRKPTVSDALAIEMANVPVKKPAPLKLSETPKPDAAKKEESKPEPPERLDQDRIELFGMPIRDSGRILTALQVPRGKWVLAGSFQSPPEEKKPLCVFVKAEVEEP